MVNGRVRVYGTNSFMKLEEQLIKERYFGAKSSDAIHHKDGDKSNNKVTDLGVITLKEHSKLHGMENAKNNKVVWRHLLKYKNKIVRKYGKDSPHWIEKSKEELIEMLKKAKGVILHVGTNKKTFRNKCNIVGLNYKEIKSMFSKNGTYLDCDTVSKAVYRYQNKANAFDKAARELGIGRIRLKSLCKKYDIATNHMILSSKKCW